MDIAFNTKPAVSFMSVSFDGEVIEELNDHIDNELIDTAPAKEPIKFSHTLDYVGKMFGDYICRLSGTYMKNSNTDIVTDQNASEFSQSVTGSEHREYDCKIINMSVDRIFCDTAQEGKTEGELSCVLYLKVPEQICDSTSRTTTPTTAIARTGRCHMSHYRATTNRLSRGGRQVTWPTPRFSIARCSTAPS